MSNESCRLPNSAGKDDATIRRLLAGRRIAVVGLSDDPMRPSHDVAAYLLRAGYDIIAVNPAVAEVFGRRSYARLLDVPGAVDVVNVFRRSEFVVEIVREAVEKGAKGIWLQQGVWSNEAERIARDAQIDFVQDRCIKVEHARRVTADK